MSESNEKDGEGSHNDEFDFYIQFTKPLVLDLRSSEDKAIASAWVQKLEVPPQNEEEKKLRLDYLKLLLFVLQRGRLSGIFKKQPAPGSLQPFPQGLSMADMGNLIIDRDETQSSGGGDTQSVPYTIELSSDLREFVAAQEIPHFGVQMYYAWSSDDAVHKWSLFDEDKFSSYIIDKIKQLKDAKPDDKGSKTCTKKPCDLSFTKNYTKSKVKSPEEIEKSQGRSYQTYVGLVGRMGGGFKDCDDDQDKYPRRPGSSKKCGPPRRCQIEGDEEYENFLTGLSGFNSSQKRTCKCPYQQHRPDCEAHGKGVQPFEERNPRSMSPKSKPETGACNVWPPQGAGGSKRLNVSDQREYGSQYSPAIPVQRSMPSPRNISPIRHDMSTTGPPGCKDSNRTATCSCPMPPCTCPCPRQSPQQNFQLDVPRAAVGPSPSAVPHESSGRSGGDKKRMISQRPVNVMPPSESSGRSGGEAAAQLHCFNPQYQVEVNIKCPKTQPAVKINQDWYPDEEFDKKSQGDDRRKQKIANLSKIIAKEAREEDELDMFSSYKGPQPSPQVRQNFECPPNFSSQGSSLPQSPSKMRATPNQGKTRQQQQPQGDNICYDFGPPPSQSAPPPSNPCYSGGYQQPVTNNMNQGSYTMSAEYKRKPKSNRDTSVKSLGYSPQNQVQYEDRSPCQFASPNMRISERTNLGPTAAQQGEPCNNVKSPSMNRPKSQSDSCQDGGFASSNAGRVHDLASVFQGIKLRAEAHREKCNQSGSRRSQSGEPPVFRTPQSRSVSPFPNQPSYQASASQNKSQPQSQPQSQTSGKSCPEGMAEGMMPNQYADHSQNEPVVWAPPSTYNPPPGMRQALNFDTTDYSREGTNSSGKGICNPMTNQQSQSPGAHKYLRNGQGPQNCQGSSPSNYQRPPPSTYQGYSPPNYQGPSPSTYQRLQTQGLPPSTYQGSPPANFQELNTVCPAEDENPCDEEDEVSCPESYDECPPGSSTSAECVDNTLCEDIQQWPAPGPSTRRSPDGRAKEYGQNIQDRRRIIVTSTPVQPPFLAEESAIQCVAPPPCTMDYQYEQGCGTYVIPAQEPTQDAQFYPIFGNSDNDCVQGGGPSQGFSGFMEMPNDTQGTVSTTINRRRNMLAAPMPDEQQFSLSQTSSQFNSCNNKSGY